MTATDALPRLLERLKRVQPVGGDRWIASCPVPGHGQGRGDVHPSLSVARGNGSGPLIKCHAGCATEDVLAAVGLTWSDLLPPRGTRKPAADKASRATAEARRAVSESSDKSGATEKSVVTEYPVRSVAGELIAVHLRTDLAGGRKKFWWRLPDGTLGLGGRPVSSLPLYGSERLRDLAPDEPVVIVEGEKGASALVAAGIPAVGTVTGASGTPGDEALRPLLGRTVYLWPDADEPGRRHMDRIGAALLRLGHRDVRVITWQGAPASGDAADLLALEGGLDEVHALLDEARPFKAAGQGEEPVPLFVKSALEIVPKPVSWLWPNRLPLGKLVIIAGEPGRGKSRLALSIAATVSKGGSWPALEGSCVPGEVLIANFEDDVEDTSIPRLQAEGADLSKIRFFIAVPDPNGPRALDLGRDADRIAKYLELYPATRLLIVDPISAILGGIDSHKNAEVRAVLHPLADVARRYNVCVVAITHLSKAGNTRALHRVIGSVAFTAAARVAFLVTRDEDDPEGRRHLFLSMKNNLGEDQAGLSFSTDTVTLSSGIRAPRIVWGGRVTVTADESVAPPDEERGAINEAVDFLRDLLAEGPVEARQVMTEAKKAGISQRTLIRAKEKLRVKSGRLGFGPWRWELR